MKRCCEIREVLVKISFITATQLFGTIGIALGRDVKVNLAVSR